MKNECSPWNLEEIPPDKWDNCREIVNRSRKRYCRFARLDRFDYCIHHLRPHEIQQLLCEKGDEWKYCDLCKTLVRNKVFLKHSSKCPVKRRKVELNEKEEYEENLNLGSDIESDISIDEEAFREWSKTKEFKGLAQKIEEAFATIPKISEEYDIKDKMSSKCPSNNDSHKSEPLSSKRRKHYLQHQNILHQISSMVGQESSEGGPKGCFIELGAGKAEFSEYVYRNYSKNLDLLAVDMEASLQGKADTRLRQLNPDIRFQRLTMNICHLALSKVEYVKCNTEFFLSCKHLCGCGLDYAIRCLLQMKDDLSSVGKKCLVKAVAFASCCHGKCKWSAYPNKDYFRSLGFSAHDFSRLVRVASWANILAAQGTSLDDEHVRTKIERVGDLDAAREKQQLGVKAKVLIDVGRFEILKKSLGDAKLVRFISPDITPENMLILGKTL